MSMTPDAREEYIAYLSVTVDEFMRKAEEAGRDPAYRATYLLYAQHAQHRLNALIEARGGRLH